MTATDTTAPAKTRREHTAAANAARVLHDDALALDERLCKHFEAWHEHMDPSDREYLGEKLNGLHDLVTALREMQRDHLRDADRADWTAQDWQEHALVAANID